VSTPSASSSGSPAISRLASWRVRIACSRCDSLRPNARRCDARRASLAAGSTTSGVSPCVRSWPRAARALSASITPFCARPAASIASKRNAGIALCASVTRSTSSSDVAPAASQRSASSRSVRMPCARPVARISASAALRWISERIASSTTSSSYTPRRPV
jgi:hypothetical protein